MTNDRSLTLISQTNWAFVVWKRGWQYVITAPSQWLTCGTVIGVGTEQFLFKLKIIQSSVLRRGLSASGVHWIYSNVSQNVDGLIFMRNLIQE